MDEDHKLDHIKDGFTQFVADNVDHNTDTLNGKNTFFMGWALLLVQS